MGQRIDESPTDHRTETSPDAVVEEISQRDSKRIMEEDTLRGGGETSAPSSPGDSPSDSTGSNPLTPQSDDISGSNSGSDDVMDSPILPSLKRKADEVLDDPECKRKDEYDYVRWHTVMCLDHEYQLRKETLSEEEKQRFGSILKTCEEKDCSPEVPYFVEEDYVNLKPILQRAVLTGKGLPTPKKIYEKPRKPRAPAINCRTPILVLTNTNPELLKNIPSGAEIVEKAKQWERDGSNQVYSHKIDMAPASSSENHFNSKFLERKGFALAKPGVKGDLLPVQIFDVSNGFDEEKLKEQVTSNTCCIIRGFDKAVGMDYSAFDIKKIASIIPEHKITTLRNRGQAVTTNHTMISTSSDRMMNRNPVMDTVTEYDYDMKRFSDNYEDLLEIGRKAFDDLLSNWPNRHEILRNLENDLKKNQLPFTKEKRQFSETTVVPTFGSNVDLNNGKFPDQMEEIKKLPVYLRPEEGLFAYCYGEVAGVNEPQMYFKAPGCRTPGHVENQVVASINLNLGPGDCVWYCVPMIHIAKLQNLFNKKSIYPTEAPWWIHENDLKDFGVPYQKIIQKKGDMIYVGIGTYHWVQSNGYCANVSWNVAQLDPVQLLATAVIDDFNREQRFAPVVPFMPMLWECAFEKVLPGTEFSKTVKQLLISCLAKAQFEFSSMKIRGMTSLPKEQHLYNLKDVVACGNNQKPNCANAYTYNLVACVDSKKGIQEMKERREKGLEEENTGVSIQGASYCIDCAQPSEDTAIYMQHHFSIEELIRVFDEYN